MSEGNAVKFIKIGKNESAFVIDSNVVGKVEKEALIVVENLVKYEIEINEPFYINVGSERIIIIPNWLPFKKIIKIIKFNWKNNWYLNDSDNIQILNEAYPFFNFSKMFRELHSICLT